MRSRKLHTRRYLAVGMALAMVATACGSRDSSSPPAATSAATSATTSPGTSGSSDATSPTTGASQTTSAPVSADPGITDTEVVLGGIYPYSGSVSAFGAQGKGVEAYFKYINDAEGGITWGDGHKRKVKFVTYDSAYEPQRGVEDAKRLVEQDKIFAFFNPFGSPVAAAMAPYAMEQKVPMLFVSSSSDQWGDGDKWPLAVPFSIVGSTEGSIYANYVLQANPKAKVAMLFQNDDFGKGTAEAVRRNLKGTSVSIVAEQSYQTTDPTVDSQITNLAGSGADTFIMIATPKYAAQALKKIHELGWNPLRITQTSGTNVKSVLEPVGLDISKGLVSLSWYKDVTDPQWANDPAVKLFKENAAKYGADPDDPYAGTGWLAGEMGRYLFEQVKSPTRANLMDTVLNWSTDKVDMVLPGVRLHTQAPNDRYPMEAAYIMTFDGTRWVLDSKPVDAEGQTVPTK